MIYELIGYTIGALIVFVGCGWWLKGKGRSLWFLCLIPVLGFFALIIYEVLEDKRKVAI